ncbi:HelD family protein [Longirhabdus pacifica]|uniref:HelD family protein n=1 Tax=Longirhabdus pacifica TaxID=2305227 RepID=UPI0013E8C73A|nr:3'-5' exonuclease [Longirhabdus pacifica]
MHALFDEENKHLQTVLEKLRTAKTKLDAIPPYEGKDDVEIIMDNMRRTKRDGLQRSLNEPYFGRIDFEEQYPKNEMQQIYIGKFGVEDEETNKIIIVDWRSPIASLFYAFSGGDDPVTYLAPDGHIEGLMHLKRNMMIRNQILNRVVNSYVRGEDNLSGVADEFLLYKLQDNKDNKLKDIVSTIQAEQDKIIRSHKNKALIIQGVAGSGKTTVALHRLAYLLYQYRDQIKAERLMIFAPNTMFLDYISNVLPELGIGNVKQQTFYEWAVDVLDIPSTYTVTTLLQQHKNTFELHTGMLTKDNIERFKGSVAYQQHMQHILDHYTANAVPKMDITIWEGNSIPYEKMHTWFHQEYQIYPLMKRRERVIGRIQRYINSELKAFEKHEQKEYKTKANKALKQYSKKWPNYTALSFYMDMFSKPSSLLSPYTDSIPEEFKAKTKKMLKERHIHFEDIPALLYIHQTLFGTESERLYDHIVIDEAQDYSPFQIVVLKQHAKNQSFTILGDLAQGIHAQYGIWDWNEMQTLFPNEDSDYFELQVSYRSTAEIIQFANQVIGKSSQPCVLAEPVMRSGQEVQIHEADEKQLPQHIKHILQADNDYQTYAIVTKTEQEAIVLHEALQQLQVNCNYMTDNLDKYEGGISILPAYLTKGLEFDVVIITHVNETQYTEEELDIKLLYVACTRALHQLHVMHDGHPSPLLSVTS